MATRRSGPWCLVTTYGPDAIVEQNANPVPEPRSRRKPSQGRRGRMFWRDRAVEQYCETSFSGIENDKTARIKLSKCIRPSGLHNCLGSYFAATTALRPIIRP
jgi:hypothetical protein